MSASDKLSLETRNHIQHYIESCDPLLMMHLLMELGRIQRQTLSEEEYREISGCHNLLSALSRSAYDN